MLWGGMLTGEQVLGGNIVEGRYALQLDGNIMGRDVLVGGAIGRHCKGDIACGDNVPCNGKITGRIIELVASRHYRWGFA